MKPITLRAHYPHAPEVVWAELAQLERHVQWMLDAASLDFVTTTTRGVGTEFRCRTKIGPFVVTDVMTVTDWVDEQTMAVAHKGIVQGVGRFTLEADGEGGTFLTWQEQLRFPWYLGGVIGQVIARPIFYQIWTLNLRNFGRQLP